jgi:hypothetical protein
MSKKTYTLRGSVDLDGAGSVEELLFNYEAMNLDQGWIVKSADIWFGMRTRSTVNPGTLNAHTAIKMQLQTDTMGTSVSDSFTADDNRAFGWYWANYNLNEGLGNITPNDREYVLDPDHLVSRQLWATFSNETGVNFEGYAVRINYLIVLEKVKTTPAENILQQVKSVAQDILN